MAHPSGGRVPDTETSRKRPRPPLGIRGILARAARAGRGNWARILIVAVVVSGAASLAEIAAHTLVDRTSLPQSAVSDLATSAVSLLGVVLLSGFLGRLVGEGHGRPHASIGGVIRSLPWLRLILADLLVVLLVILGLILLVIPGFVVMNLLAVTGPVIEIEHRRVVAALRRSASMIRHRFWTVLLLATVPVLLVSEIPGTFPESGGAPAIAVFAALRLAEAVAEAALSLVLVELCYRLIELDAARLA